MSEQNTIRPSVLLLWSLLMLAALSLGCAAARADVLLTIAPDPVPITGFNFGHGMIVDQAQWTVRVTEMAGLGGEIEVLTALVRDVATGQPVGEVSSSDYGTHVNDRQSVAIQQSWQVPRDIGDAFRPRRFEVTLQFKDEKGNRTQQTLTAAGAYQ